MLLLLRPYTLPLHPFLPLRPSITAPFLYITALSPRPYYSSVPLHYRSVPIHYHSVLPLLLRSYITAPFLHYRSVPIHFRSVPIHYHSVPIHYRSVLTLPLRPYITTSECSRDARRVDTEVSVVCRA